MRRQLAFFLRTLALATAIFTGSSPDVFAIDGVKLITQASAMAGNVTPGDLPGFPVTISLRGSYKLASDLVLPAAHITGIEISASEVTLDLNGFSIVGVGQTWLYNFTGFVTGFGIVGSSSATNVTVFNGSVVDTAASGVKLGAHARVQNVRVHNVRGVSTPFSSIFGPLESDGIVVGHGSIVRDSTASGNAGNGILNGSYSLITGNTTFGNVDSGIRANCPSNIAGNVGSIDTTGTTCGLFQNVQ
jgi:hypothetical protein